MKSVRVYADQRVYVLRNDSNGSLKPICRMMAMEIETDDSDTPWSDTIDFFIDTKCGCDYVVDDETVFLMPDGTFYQVMKPNDINDHVLTTLIVEFKQLHHSEKHDMFFFVYKWPDGQTISLVESLYSKNSK